MNNYPLYDVLRPWLREKHSKVGKSLNDVLTITLFWEKCQINYFVHDYFQACNYKFKCYVRRDLSYIKITSWVTSRLHQSWYFSDCCAYKDIILA